MKLADFTAKIGVRIRINLQPATRPPLYIYRSPPCEILGGGIVIVVDDPMVRWPDQSAHRGMWGSAGNPRSAPFLQRNRSGSGPICSDRGPDLVAARETSHGRAQRSAGRPHPHWPTSPGSAAKVPSPMAHPQSAQRGSGSIASAHPGSERPASVPAAAPRSPRKGPAAAHAARSTSASPGAFLGLPGAFSRVSWMAGGGS